MTRYTIVLIIGGILLALVLWAVWISIGGL